MTGSLPLLLSSLSGASDVAPLAQEWSSLDHEIEELAASLHEGEKTGPQITGWIRTRYANSNDVDVDATTPGDQDLGGFNLDNARIVISGEAADGYAYTLSFEGGDPAVSDANGTDVAIVDAFASVKLGDWAAVSVGRFSTTVLWNSGVEERRLLFLDRSFLDEVWDGRDVGFEFSGVVERLNWWAAAQNGSDGGADEYGLSARVSYHLLGDALYTREGVHGLAPDEEHLTVGVGWFDDTNLDDGTAIGADVVFAKGAWSAVGEVVDFDSDVQPVPVINLPTGTVIPSGSAVTGSEMPWGATVGYMVVPNEWEIAARWQDLDDDADSTVLSAAVNRYFAGHDAKWTLQFDTLDSDDAALEADTVALGLTVGF